MFKYYKLQRETGSFPVNYFPKKRHKLHPNISLTRLSEHYLNKDNNKKANVVETKAKRPQPNTKKLSQVQNAEKGLNITHQEIIQQSVIQYPILIPKSILTPKK